MKIYAARSRKGLWLIAAGFVFQLAAVGVDAASDSRAIATGMTISFSHANWHALIGLAITVALGFGVGSLVKRVGDSIPLLPPAGDDPRLLEAWTQLVGQSTGGGWIGHVERPLFFAACWLQAWLLITGWLVFKLAFYWQGANFTAFPRTPPDAEHLRWVATKRQLGSHHVATALAGTGANIVLALVGVACGKWINLQ
jgi:hypothetical protein